MKISNQLSKLALVTYALVGIGVLGWSRVGVGEDYAYTVGGDAKENGAGPFSYKVAGSSQNPNSGQGGVTAGDKSDDKFEIPSTPTGNDSQPPVSQDPSTGTGNAQSRGGLCSMECTKDTDCGCASEAGGKKLVCCIPKGSDAMGERGTCKEKKQCDGSGNDGDNPQDPSNPTPTPVPNNNKCEKDWDCSNSMLPAECALGNRKCEWNEDQGGKICICEGFSPGQCRDNQDCHSWYESGGMSGKCNNKEWFICKKGNEARDMWGTCTCEPPASCENKPDGESCSECKHQSGGSCVEKGGACECMNGGCICKSAQP